MPRPRQSTEVLRANGRKHLSQSEEAQRRAGEVSVPPAQKIVAPKWMGRGFDEATVKSLQSEFRKLGKKLLEVGLFTELDGDTLAHYLVARHQWELATVEVESRLAASIKNSKELSAWTLIQDRFFSSARKSANEMGLTLTSRCRLVIPEGLRRESEEEDEFTKALHQRMGIA